MIAAIMSLRKLSFAFLVAFFTGCLFPASLLAEQAELTYVSGTVEVLFADAGEYTQGEEGMILEAGDSVKTGSGASAELSFNEANTNLLRLSENTEAKAVFSGDEKLEMTCGEIFASISSLPSESAFEIRTPTAVSGARGTDWVTKVTDEGTDIEAVEDVPYVRHFEANGSVSRESTPVNAGQMTTIRKFEKPRPPQPIPAIRQQEWKQVKFDVRQRGSEAAVRRMYRPQFDRKDFIQQLKEKKGPAGEKGKPGAGNMPGEGKEKPIFDSMAGPRKEGQQPDTRDKLISREGEKRVQPDAQKHLKPQQQEGTISGKQEGAVIKSPQESKPQQQLKGDKVLQPQGTTKKQQGSNPAKSVPNSQKGAPKGTRRR
ncbi:MAG: FecR family protein [Candidatus Omnitrophica bacterium]|nr:FecR family protein [Candidatus Omnitrophota bacterium]